MFSNPPYFSNFYALVSDKQFKFSHFMMYGVASTLVDAALIEDFCIQWAIKTQDFAFVKIRNHLYSKFFGKGCWSSIKYNKQAIHMSNIFFIVCSEMKIFNK